CPCASAPSPTSRRTAAVARMTSTSGRTSIERAESTGPVRGAQQRRAKKPRSGAGMMLAMDRAQALRGDGGIDLGSPDVGVSPESLDDAEIGAPTEEVGREGMPERMRGDARVDAGGPRAPAHELPDRLAAEWLPARADEDVWARAPAEQPRALVREI